MRRFRTALVLGFSAALAALALVPSPSASPRPALPATALTLRCSILKQTPQLLHVQFSGAAPYPDDAVVRFRLFRCDEQDRRGMLERSLVPAGNGAVQVAGRTFSFDQLLRDPGLYRVELQGVHQEIPRWTTFDCVLWGDDLIPRLQSELEELESAALRLTRRCVRMHIASQSRKEWDAKVDRLMAEVRAVEAGLHDRLAPLYPASYQQVVEAARLLTKAPAHFFWKPDGSFEGAFDAGTGKWVREPYGGLFTLERMINFVQDCRQTARRELALWLVKEARRTGHRRALPEVATLLKGFEAGEDLDAIEARIRGNAQPVSADADPLPPFFVNRQRRLTEATLLLGNADRKWDEFGDGTAPGLYRKLLHDYPREVEILGARVRVANRARDD